MSWDESMFVTRAKEIAAQHVTSKKSINDLAMKVAQDHSLNPEEIRTLVRLSNVATFQEVFQRKNDGDKMVEFDVGDPEQIIRKFAVEANTVPQSANIENDKLASEIPDLMREKRLGGVFDVEKTAGEFEPVVERPLRHDLALIAGRKLAENFEIERFSAGRRWEEKIAALAKVFRRAPGYGPKFEEFEKDAYAEFGQDVLPELTQLWENMRSSGTYSPLTNEKVALLQDRRVTDGTAELALLKEAVEARHAYVKFGNGLETLKSLV